MPGDDPHSEVIGKAFAEFGPAAQILLEQWRQRTDEYLANLEKQYPECFEHGQLKENWQDLIDSEDRYVSWLERFLRSIGSTRE